MTSFQTAKLISGCCLIFLAAIAGCADHTRIIKAKAAPESSQTTPSTKIPQPANETDSLVEAGVMAFENNDLQYASRLLQQAYQADSLDWRAPYLLGRISTVNRSSEQAEKWLSVSLATAPNDPQVRALIYENLGYNCEMGHEYGKAKLHYTAALQLNAESAKAQSGLKRLQSMSEISR